MGASDSSWFRDRPASAARDFFALCEHARAVLEASAHTLTLAGGELPCGTPTQAASEILDRMGRARDGDWRPLDQLLRSAGQRAAQAELEVSVWFGIANVFHSGVAALAIDHHAGEPARLTAVVRVLGDVVERGLALIAGCYAAVKHQRVSESQVGHRRAIDAALDASEIDKQRLDESTALRDHALEHAQFGIAITDPATHRFLNVNPAYARIVGYEPGELIGSIAPRLAAQVSMPAVVEIARILEQQGHHTYEMRLTRKDSSTVPVLVSTTTVRTRSGTALRVSTVIDNSERDHLAQAREAATVALERSAARLEILSSTSHEFATLSGSIDELLGLVARRLTEIIGDGCAVRLTSQDGLWLEPTTAFHHRNPDLLAVGRAVFSAAREPVGSGIGGRVAGTGVAELIPVIDTERMLAVTAPVFRPMIAQVDISSVLAVPLRSRGRTIGAISLVRLRGTTPYTIEDQYFAQDIADRAGLAIDNAVLVATLEGRVVERTAALESVNRELEAFSYSVSHDLRTPLRAIDGFSQALASDYHAQLDDRARHYLQRIRASTQRMSALINDLLNLARITRVPLAIRNNDVSVLASEVVAELRKRDPARTVEVHIAPSLSVRADAGLLRSVLENLIGNAWKFTSQHPDAQIWIGSDAGAFFVRDTGAGFDMAYADKLFTPFHRLHPSNEYDGTGVGLATVHRIIARHGGRIWAEARAGQGATFFFTLGELERGAG